MSLSVIHGNQNTTKLIAQLKRAPIQYKSLSKEEEQQLIDEHRDNRDELNRLLFMHNIRAVFAIAKTFIYRVGCPDFDVLVQDGMQGLAEGVKRFDIDKGIKCITYVSIWIRKYMLLHFTDKNKMIRAKTVSLNTPTTAHSSSEDEAGTLEDCVNDFIDPTYHGIHTIGNILSSDEQKDICKRLYDNLESDKSLSATDIAVFTDMFYHKEKTKDVARKYKLELKTVCDIRHKILSKMKFSLEKDFGIKSYSELYED